MEISDDQRSEKTCVEKEIHHNDVRNGKTR